MAASRLTAAAPVALVPRLGPAPGPWGWITLFLLGTAVLALAPATLFGFF